MEVRTEQRNELPLSVEEIGLGKWHLRWDIREVAPEAGDDNEQAAPHYEYNEVTIDHEPTQEEFNQLTAQ